MLDNKANRLKEKVILRIFDAAHMNMKMAYEKWKRSIEIRKIIDALTAEKKKLLIETLNNAIGNSVNGKLRIIL
jgi:hypothetical protein